LWAGQVRTIDWSLVRTLSSVPSKVLLITESKTKVLVAFFGDLVFHGNKIYSTVVNPHRIVIFAELFL